MKADESAEELLSIRKHTQLYLLKNPNYFGTIQDIRLSKIYKQVYELNSKNHYEQLGWLTYNPSTEKLNAVVIIKKAKGYLGTPSQGGSKEYVRFYVDYDHSGNWIDEGTVSLGVYDHTFEDELYYEVESKIVPKIKNYWDKELTLPRVKAILSWNTMPPSDRPNWNYIWGDILDQNIQIAPRKDWFCLFTHLIDHACLDKKANSKLNESKMVEVFE